MEGYGTLSFGSVKVPKSANRLILFLFIFFFILFFFRSTKRFFCVTDSCLKDSAFTAVQRDAKSQTRYVKGVPFVNRRHSKGVPFT